MTGIVTALVIVLALGAGGSPQAVRTVGDIRLDMSLTKTAYNPGEPVIILMSMTNTSGSPVVLTIPSGQQYDVYVRQRGAMVWQWSHDKAFVQVVREVTLAPGQTQSFQVSWDQRDLQGRRVEPGIYDISGLFMIAQRAGPPTVEVGPVRISIGR